MSVFEKIFECLAKDDKTKPAFIVCKELLLSEKSNDEPLLLKFVAFKRSTKAGWDWDGYMETPGSDASRKLIGYFNITTKNKMKFLYKKMDKMKEDEFGISPIIIKGKKEFKIPMIDFVGSDIGSDTFQFFAYKLGKEFPEAKGSKLMIFSSGRSYHGYLNKLVTNEAFYRFEKFLAHSANSIVDQEWVKCDVKILRWSRIPNRFGCGGIEPQFLKSFNIP